MADASVVFVTSVFEDAQTGPGTYARYVWRDLRDHPRFPTLVVAPTTVGAPGVVAVEPPRRFHSLRLYARLRTAAGRAADALDPPVILHMNNAYQLGSLRRHRGPIVVQLNDYMVAEWKQTIRRKVARKDVRGALSTAYRYLHERRGVAAASVVVCNSEATATSARSAYRLDRRKVRVIHKAVDVTRFTRPDELPPDPWGAAAGGRLILVGTDFQTKGLDVLLAALVGVRRTHPEVQLAVVGPVHRGNERFRTLANELDLGANVAFLGRLDHAELARWLWWATVAVQPSRAEALGVAALEAMAAGVPVVASHVGGLPEIVSSRNGWLVPAEDPRALEETLRAVLDDEQGVRDRRAGAVETARGFGVERMLASLVELYESVTVRA